MKLNEESSDFVYLGKRIDKALDYIQNNKPNLLDWFNQYIEIPYQDIMSGELELEEEDYIFDYLDSLLDDLEEKFNIIFEIKQTKMTNETLRMQLLSGVITESEYKAKLEESKKPLNENFVGMGMVGNIFDREKTDYELAFEHFTKGTSLNEDMEEDLDEDISSASIYQEGKKWVVSHPVANRLEKKEFDTIEDAYAYYAKVKHKGASTMEEVEEGNLYHNETASLTPEGRFWIVSWRGMDGPKERVFTDEDEARAFMNTLEEGKKPGTAKERSAMAKKARAGKDIGEKGKNFEKIAKSAAKKYGSKEAGKRVAGAVMWGKLGEVEYEPSGNPRIDILAKLDSIDDVAISMLEDDIKKAYGPDEARSIYSEYMKFIKAVKNLID